MLGWARHGNAGGDFGLLLGLYHPEGSVRIMALETLMELLLAGPIHNMEDRLAFGQALLSLLADTTPGVAVKVQSVILICGLLLSFSISPCILK